MKTDLAEILQKALVGRTVVIGMRKPAKIASLYVENHGYGAEDTIMVEFEGKELSYAIGLQEDFDLLWED